MKRAFPAGSPLTGVPHWLQNRDSTGKSVPHAPQVAPKRVPQPKQKFDLGGFAYWHRGQFMLNRRPS